MLKKADSPPGGTDPTWEIAPFQTRVKAYGIFNVQSNFLQFSLGKQVF